MNRMHLIAAAVAVALVSGVTIAQTADKPVRAQSRLDANADGVVDRAEAAAFPRLAERFDQLDRNKDGKLDASERPARHNRTRRMHVGMPGGMGMAAMDSDGDGRVSKAEAQAHANRVVERFDAMDVNRDGYLDRSDKLARKAERRAAFFATADADKDGRLSRDEFAKRRNAHASGHPPRMQTRGKAAGNRTPPSEAERARRVAAAFERLDTDKDGSISRAEFDAARPMRGQGRPVQPSQPR